MFDQKLRDYLKYDEASPSGLVWIKKHNNASRIKIGEKAGSLDNGYWRLNSSIGCFRVHRFIWWLHYGEIPDKFCIDHMDGNPSNNRITNLRLVNYELNSRNRRINKNNKVGCGMITYGELYSKKGTLLRKYTVAIYLETNKKTSKSFSCLKYGDSLALAMAKEWREVKLLELKQSGHGYTERHGL